MTRAFLAVAILLALCVPGSAQQRVPNQGTPGILRAWPQTGAWQVALLRLFDGAFGCWLVTGFSDQGSREQYFWGIRWRSENVAATIADNNEGAISGPSIQVIVDQIPAGTYQINRRLSSNVFHNVAADMPRVDGDRILSLINVGGVIQFKTSTFTYSAPLQGASQGLQNLKACSVEAGQFGSAPASTAPVTPR
jgi:hypothetical protein